MEKLYGLALTTKWFICCFILTLAAEYGRWLFLLFIYFCYVVSAVYGRSVFELIFI